MRKLMGEYGIAALLAVAGILSPGAALALGLGQIQCNTRIGQPLSARIPILAADRNSLQGLTVGLAEPDAYRQAGLGEPDFLFRLKFQVEQGDNGPYVLITSEQPVRLPFLNLLVHASWPSGEVTRKYTVLLNPPIFAAATSAAPVSVPAAPAARPAPRQPVRQPPIRRQATPPAPAAPQTYGPVRHGETLWHIASGLAARDGVGVNRMMIALYRANPGAFFGNINRLEAGAVLRVPARRRIEAIARGEATREVASQNREWRAARATPGLASSPRPTVAASAKTAGQTGEVVLTAPAVTGAKANAAAAGAATAAGAAAGIAAGSAVSSGGKSAGTTAPAAPVSAGGPVKVHSKEMAKLAAAPPVKKKKPPASPAANAFNSVNAANTGTEETSKSVFWNWITTPKGWIVIAAILILFALLLFLLVRRARGGRRGAGPDGAGPPTSPRDRAAIENAAAVAGASSSAFDGGEAEADAVVAESDAQEEDAGADIASYAGGMQQPLAEEEASAGEAAAEFESAEADEMADVFAAADFYAGHGDHGGAADVLRTALADNPGRQDVRRRLLEELFAAGYAQGFRDEAARFRESAPAESDWRSVAAMGRQLLPGDELFADSDAQAPPEAAEAELPEALEITELELELDKFSGMEAEHDLQDDFERTLGELSTMIETYVPGSEDGPVALQLPPGEGGTATPAEEEPMAANEEPPLELEPEEGTAAREEMEETESTEEAEPTPASEPEMETGISLTAPEEAAEEGATRDDISGTRLDLARAYLDMGDRESARDVLEEVLDEGDEAQREEARRLLESLT